MLNVVFVLVITLSTQEVRLFALEAFWVLLLLEVSQANPTTFFRTQQSFGLDKALSSLIWADGNKFQKSPSSCLNSSGFMCHVRQSKLNSAVSHNEQQKYLVTKGPGLLKADLFFLLLLPKKHSKGPIKVGGREGGGPLTPGQHAPTLASFVAHW